MNVCGGRSLRKNSEVSFFGGQSYSHSDSLIGLNETHTHFGRFPRFKDCWTEHPVRPTVRTQTVKKHI